MLTMVVSVLTGHVAYGGMMTISCMLCR